MTVRADGLPPRLVLATGNAGKLREMRAILAPWRVEVRPLSEFTADAAEETGLVRDLGAMVFEKSLERIAIWRREGLPDLGLAVNVSPR